MHEATMHRENIDGAMNLQAILAEDNNLGLIRKRGLSDEDLSDAEKAKVNEIISQ